MMFNVEVNMVVCIVQHQESYYDKTHLPTCELSCVLATQYTTYTRQMTGKMVQHDLKKSVLSNNVTSNEYS